MMRHFGIGLGNAALNAAHNRVLEALASSAWSME